MCHAFLIIIIHESPFLNDVLSYIYKTRGVNVPIPMIVIMLRVFDECSKVFDN
jgi:hypothetical protein